MLMRFTASIFLSFKEPTEFSMMASKVTRHASLFVKSNQHKILNVALFLELMLVAKLIY